MLARYGLKWGTALVYLMLLGGCLQEDPAGNPAGNNPNAPGETMTCATVYAPVCGKDGKTYGNSCETGKVGVASQGECAK